MLDESIPSAAREVVPSETRNPIKVCQSVLRTDGWTFMGFLVSLGNISLAAGDAIARRD
jgi:hypothetical protein